MEDTLYVAKALYDMYLEQTGVYMDEMKMHKLMYFSQRESLMYNQEALFVAMSLTLSKSRNRKHL